MAWNSNRSGEKTIAAMARYLAVLACTSVIYAAEPLHFANYTGNGQWKMSGNALRCGLSFEIPNYGVGYFEQYATQQPHFVLRKWQGVQHVFPARITALPPSWKPYGKASLIGTTFARPGDFAIYLRRTMTLRLLDYLLKGYNAQFSYRSEQGFDETVLFSPIYFRPAFAKYQRCLGGLLPFNFNAVKHSVFYFKNDSRELSEANQMQLKRIRQYIEADERVEKVRVIGYTDNSGRRGYNNAISQKRAEAVRDYLIKVGVPESLIAITWKGPLDPVAENDTDEGRAANRRVVVDLFKE